MTKTPIWSKSGGSASKPCGTIWVAVYLTEAIADAWPFDVGDDPSFRKYLDGSGPLSWGICRQDVRNAT
jgi:hypothetical protein